MGNGLPGTRSVRGRGGDTGGQEEGGSSEKVVDQGKGSIAVLE